MEYEVLPKGLRLKWFAIIGLWESESVHVRTHIAVVFILIFISTEPHSKNMSSEWLYTLFTVYTDMPQYPFPLLPRVYETMDT